MLNKSNLIPSLQSDETNNTTSDEETSSKRSVRFNEDSGVGDSQTETTVTDDESKSKSENQLTDYVTHMSLKRHSSLFHNALRRKLRKTSSVSFRYKLVFNLDSKLSRSSTLSCQIAAIVAHTRGPQSLRRVEARRRKSVDSIANNHIRRFGQLHQHQSHTNSA